MAGKDNWSKELVKAADLDYISDLLHLWDVITFFKAEYVTFLQMKLYAANKIIITFAENYVCGRQLLLHLRETFGGLLH